MFSISPKFSKLESLIKNQLPTRSEIRNYHGSLLTNVYCDFGSPEIRKFLGIVPPLRGPGDNLWISPFDDHLADNNNRRRLKPVSVIDNDTHLQKAFTHEAILKIGEKTMEKYEKEMEEKLFEKLQESRKEIYLKIEAEKRNEIKLYMKKIEEKLKREIIRYSKEYEKRLENETADAAVKFNKQLQKAVVQTRMDVSHEMMKKLRDEIGYVVVDLDDEYQRKLRAQRDNMVADFNQIMRHERDKTADKIRTLEQQKLQDMKILQVEMENKIIENENKIINCQRKQYEHEKEIIYQEFEKKLKKVEESLFQANKTIENLTKNEEKEYLSPTNDDFWKDKIKKIFIEFQKLITFAFKSVPGQTEYLLSLESLLKLESNEKLC